MPRAYPLHGRALSGKPWEAFQRDERGIRWIPIIAFTANVFEEDVKQCFEAGMNAHLSKPVDINARKLTLGRLITEGKQNGK